MQKTYDAFWTELAAAYPVSHGTMRVPIVAELQELEGVAMSEVLGELQRVLELMLEQAGYGEAARARASAAGEAIIAPYITDAYTGVVRFDCVLTESGVKILELNADYPDGLLLHDRTYGALADARCQLHETAFLSYFDTASTIHISHALQAGFLDAYYLEKEVLEAAGHTVTIGGVGVQASWHRRCVEASKLVADDMAWCTDAAQQHLNSFALRTLGYKDLLAQVQHPYVPRTMVLDAASQAEVVAEPNRFVLKPANGCEGNGIFFGREHPPAAWADIVAALPPGYIAQEYVTLPQRTVPIYEDGGVVERTLYYDFCPHFFIREGQVVGSGHILMRFSASPVVNVTKGGAIGYHRL